MATVVLNLVVQVRDADARRTLHGSTRLTEDKANQLKVL
jgi:hypothetical protein